MLSKEPAWCDGETCLACNVRFGITTRRHHWYMQQLSSHSCYFLCQHSRRNDTIRERCYFNTHTHTHTRRHNMRCYFNVQSKADMTVSLSAVSAGCASSAVCQLLSTSCYCVPVCHRHFTQPVLLLLVINGAVHIRRIRDVRVLFADN